MDELPPNLRDLINRFTVEVDNLITRLEGGTITVPQWQDEMNHLIARYSTAAAFAGWDGTNIPDAGLVSVIQDVRVQLEFLGDFALVIQSTPEFLEGWRARAAMYARSIKTPYWRGATRFLPLPAMPAEGTQCLTNCKCAWEIVTVDADAGDYDAYWRLGANENHCQTCPERAAAWNPVRIRGGVLL